MKFYSKIFLPVIFGILFPAFLNAQNCKASINISTDLDSALIYINKNFAGKGSVKTELEKGIYIITANEPAYIWNAKSITDTLKVYDCSESKNLIMNFNNSYYLQTDPQDASVYLRDSLIGYTPLFVSGYFNMVELKKPGFEDKSLAVNSLPSKSIVKMNYIGIPNGKSFFQRGIFKILVGSIVVLGGVTAYFKLKADDRFSQYQATGESGLLKQTKRYDMISGITMGALEINFGVLMYYFLKD